MSKTVQILLADDDKDDRLFFSMALKDITIQTHLTMMEDGQKLMQYLKENEGELPDVIFLDINMPRKNGSECLDEIKNDPKIKHIPIIMYSTSKHEEVVDSLYEKGAHYYLEKPNFIDLPNAITKILTALIENPQRPSKTKFLVNTLETNF